MPLPFKFDHKNPDYREVFEYRINLLNKLRSTPVMIDAFRGHYKNNIIDMINDFGCTFDPRLVTRGLPAAIPFILFEKQEEWVHFTLEKWRNGEPALTVKSRDMGCSWLLMSVFCCVGLVYDNVNLGVGSRKATYVDEGASPKSLFYKARKFLELLPPEFNGGWNIKNKTHSKQNLIYFPSTGSTISGESGDSIGRGDRASIYAVDESAFIEHPDLIDASLSATTDCRIDVSTPCGMGNSFAQKVMGGKIAVFYFHWKDDPRKDDEWYRKKCAEIDNPVIIAQELDLSFSASISGILIQSEWIEAAVDAHVKLGIEPSGWKLGALDIADEGQDKCAYGGRHGLLLNFSEEWSGKGSDTFESCEKSFIYADMHGHEFFEYDGDGLGAGIKGDSRIINERRAVNAIRVIPANMFRGSASGQAMYDPDGEMIPERKNKDFFENNKALAWWALHERFKKTYRAVAEGRQFDPNDIISLSSDLPLLSKIKTELNQPTYMLSKNGKVMINKKPDGTRSPNLADMIMMLFNPGISYHGGWDRFAD